MSSITDPTIPEISWFSALCDDDYEFLGQPDPALAARGSTAQQSYRQPIATASTTCCCPRATRWASTRRPLPPVSPPRPSRSTCCSPSGWARCISPSWPVSWPPSIRWLVAALHQHHQLRHPGRSARVRTAVPAHAGVDAGAPSDYSMGEAIDFHGEFVDLRTRPATRSSTVDGTSPSVLLRRLLGRRRRTSQRPRPMSSSPGPTPWHQWAPR